MPCTSVRSPGPAAISAPSKTGYIPCAGVFPRPCFVNKSTRGCHYVYDEAQKRDPHAKISLRNMASCLNTWTFSEWVDGGNMDQGNLVLIHLFFPLFFYFSESVISFLFSIFWCFFFFPLLTPKESCSLN